MASVLSAIHRCLRKPSLAMLSGPRCCARSRRPWASPSCRPKWTASCTARCRCVGLCPGRRLPAAGTAQGPRSLAYVYRTQPLLFPVDTGCGGVLRHRSVSPSGLLDTTISEEVRQGPGPEEEREAQRPPPSGTGRRHTLAEVSTFSPCAPPCKCPRGQEGGPVSGSWPGLRGADVKSAFSAGRSRVSFQA